MGTIVTIPKPSTDQRSPEALNQAFSRGFSFPASKTTEIILARHAEPDYPAARDSEDPWDPPLSERGRAQAMRLARRLKSLDVAAVYASTMRRAFETATIVAAAQDLPVTHVYELREISFDPATLTRALKSGERPQDLASQFLASPHWDTLPGFEPAEQFRRRVAEATQAIVARHRGAASSSLATAASSTPTSACASPSSATCSSCRSTPPSRSCACCKTSQRSTH